MLGIYPSPRFPSAGLQKQWLRKPSPRCNLEWIYTCGTIETWYLGDLHSVRQNVSSLSQVCQRKGGSQSQSGGCFACHYPPRGQARAWLHAKGLSSRGNAYVTWANQVRIVTAISLFVQNSLLQLTWVLLYVCVCLSILQKSFRLAFTVHLKKGTVAGCRAPLHPILLHGGLEARSTTVFLQ